MRTRHSTDAKKGAVGIRTKLVAALVVFTVLILFVIWLLQIKLLAYFYEREKFSELEEAYLDICTYIGDKDFASKLTKTAERQGLFYDIVFLFG